MSIAGIFALGGGCYDNDKRHRKSSYHRSYKKDDDHGYSYYRRSYKCDDCYDDDDDDGLLSGLL